MKRTKIFLSFTGVVVAALAMGRLVSLAQDSELPREKPTKEKSKPVPGQNPIFQQAPSFTPVPYPTARYAPTGPYAPANPNFSNNFGPGHNAPSQRNQSFNINQQQPYYGNFANATIPNGLIPPAFDPVANQERMAADQRFREWISKLQSPESDESEKAEAKTKLREAMLDRFNKEQKDRKAKVEQLEEQLALLKKQIAKREEAFPKLVELRIQLIEQDADGDMPELSNPPTPIYNPSPIQGQ